MDPIDDALAQEPAIGPDAAFTANVMAAVRRETAAPPLAFPWRRFLSGATASAGAPLLAALAGIPAPPPETAEPLAWMVMALFGTWVCYAASMRLARTL